MSERLKRRASGMFGLALGLIVGGTATAWYAAAAVALLPLGIALGIIVAQEADRE